MQTRIEANKNIKSKGKMDQKELTNSSIDLVRNGVIRRQRLISSIWDYIDGVCPKQEMRGSWPWEKAPQLG